MVTRYKDVHMDTLISLFVSPKSRALIILADQKFIRENKGRSRKGNLRQTQHPDTEILNNFCNHIKHIAEVWHSKITQ